MKLATGLLILGMGLGTAGAQTPSVIDNTKAKLTAVQQQKTADSNAALAGMQGQAVNQPAAPAAKPSAGKLVSAAQPQAAPPAQPTKPQAAKVSPTIAPKTQAKTQTKAKKTTSVVVNKPKQPKAAVAVEDKKNPVDPKKDAHK